MSNILRTKADIKRALSVGSKWNTTWYSLSGTAVRQVDREVEMTNTVRVKFSDGSSLYYDSDITTDGLNLYLSIDGSVVAKYQPL